MPPQSRYHRQTLLPDIGEQGQQRLTRAHAAIVGVGALGTTSAQMLARAGVGTITLIDRDIVEPTNLQRQTLFNEAHATHGTPKALAAERALTEINSTIALRAHAADFNHTSAQSLLTDERGAWPDVLIDGTDNLHTRYLINDLSVRENIPYCYAGAVGTHGLLMTVLPGESPCLRCLFPDPPAPGSLPTCDTAGVLGPLVSAVASLQAIEAMKILLGRTDLLDRTLRELDPWNNIHRAVDVSDARDPACPCCAKREFDFAEGWRDTPGARLCGRNAVQIAPSAAREDALDFEELAERLQTVGEVKPGRFTLKLVPSAEEVEFTLFRDGRAIVAGTQDESRARALYDRYIGS